jgi:hypothetical protein
MAEACEVVNGELICVCGNTASTGGWDTVDATGEVVEPIAGGDWDGLYGCRDCGRVVLLADPGADEAPVLSGITMPT